MEKTKTMRCKFYFTAISGVVLASTFAQLSPANAILFTFDELPKYSSLTSSTVDGLTANFSANPSSNGYSIQAVGTLGISPAGFSGNEIYPNTIYQSDLHITFSQPLTAFSIMYAPEEYGSDKSAIMKVTAYMNGTEVGFNTTTAPIPGTWPSGTLTFNSGTFDSVVVHWNSAPTGTENWGPIFMADNMDVTLAPVPLPAALPLFATGIGALGLLGWRRKKKASATTV